MTVSPSLAAALDADFCSVCRLLFGREVGPLEAFHPYLSEMMYPCQVRKSSLSGQDVLMGGPHYSDAARYAAQSELGAVKFKALNINQIKDIDSLFSAAAENALYCGNKLMGRNMGVEEVDNGIDCVNVMHAHNPYITKYAAFCSIGKESEHLYGVSGFYKSSSCIRCQYCIGNPAGSGCGAVRCFETYGAYDVSDSYYTFNCGGCTHCMFGFNLRSKQYVIGNLQLSKERYVSIRSKLLSEMAERLEKDRRLFSIMELGGVGESSSSAEPLPSLPIPASVETAFSQAMNIVAGKPRHGLERFSPWLMERALPRKRVAGSGGEAAMWVDLPVSSRAPLARLASLKTAMMEGGPAMRLSDGEFPSLDEIRRRASAVALYTFEQQEGRTDEVVDTPKVVHSTNAARLFLALHSTLSACSSVVTESTHIFGGYLRILNCQFCVNGYNLTRCSGCFESDSLYSCSDCYFCHNCENVEHGLFCFNVSGIRYAVCNMPVSREEFARVKKLLLDYVNGELDRAGRLEESIFNIWKKRKKES